MRITEHAKYQVSQVVKWMTANHLTDGGTQTTKNWLRFRFTHSNDSAMIAMVARDFQNKN